MEKISNAIKCVNCGLILKSPVLLPCGHSICKHHAEKNYAQKQINCLKCGRYHTLTKDGLPENESLTEIIATQVHAIDLGEAYKFAKKNFENFEDFIKHVDLVLADPSFQTCEEIDYMKNKVLLKREELKLQIDQETDKLINKFDSYLVKFKEKLKSKAFKKKSNHLSDKKRSATAKMDDFKNRFNQVILDEMCWRNTSTEITNELRILSQNLEEFNSFLDYQNDLDEFKIHTQLFENSPLFDIQRATFYIPSKFL